jgi:hypothetical protein
MYVNKNIIGWLDFKPLSTARSMRRADRRTDRTTECPILCSGGVVWGGGVYLSVVCVCACVCVCVCVFVCVCVCVWRGVVTYWITIASSPNFATLTTLVTTVRSAASSLSCAFIRFRITTWYQYACAGRVVKKREVECEHCKDCQDKVSR